MKPPTTVSELPQLTHLDAHGEVRMVDVGGKPIQFRRAVAQATLRCRRQTIQLLRQRALPKGDALTVARVAGIQAAKQTSALIPLCHPLPLSFLELEFTVRANRITAHCRAECAGRTGVEMEALTGATVAALTLYDMCKAVDQTMRLEDIRVLEKVKQ